LNRNRATSSWADSCYAPAAAGAVFFKLGPTWVGGARNSPEDAIGHAKERKAFGNGINPRRDLFEKLNA
jgi:hypothetical protein